MDIYIQDFGNSIELYIQGTKTEITEKYYSFYNWCATNGELMWLQDDIGFFWTSRYRLVKYFVNRINEEFYDENGDYPPRNLNGEIKKQALERLITLPKKEIMSRRLQVSSEPEFYCSAGYSLLS